MGSEWIVTNLGTLLKFSNGKSSPPRSDEHPILVYGSNGIIGHCTESNAQAETIIIGRVGSYCGSIYISKENCWVTDNAIKANALDGHDPTFLFYLLNLLDLNNWATGSGQPLLNQSILSSIDVTIPPLSEQKAIAYILGSLDDKIELNRQMNATLEGMAQALFKSWFVDFDLVIDNILAKNMAKCPSPKSSSPSGRSGAEGSISPSPPGRRVWDEGSIFDGIPDELTDRAKIRRQALAKGSANREAAKQFPAAFQFTEEMGWIPEGWEVRSVDSIVDRKKVNQKFTKNNVLTSGDIPVFDQGAGLLLGFHNELADIESSVMSPSFIFGDHTCITHLSIKPFSVGPNVIPLEARDYDAYWTFFAVKDIQEFQEYRRHWMEFKIKEVLVPSNKLASFFGDFIRDLYISMESNTDESTSLANLRDTLLPKLISGELRIPDTEELAEEALS